MNDYFGNELRVGDKVLFISPYHKDFWTSNIKKINKVKLSLTDGSIRKPHLVVKIFPRGFDEGTKIVN